MRSVAHVAPTPADRLSPEQRYALNRATHELHRAAWAIGQTAIALDDCDTICALVLCAYLEALHDYRTPSTPER